MTNVVLVYIKDGNYRCIGPDNVGNVGKELENTGWIHSATINPETWMETFLNGDEHERFEAIENISRDGVSAEMKMKERFDRVSEEYNRFDRVKYKRSSRQESHAVIILDRLFPEDDCILSVVAKSNKIGIYVIVGDVELTDDNIIELVRCGVMYDEEYDSLTMYV